MSVLVLVQGLSLSDEGGCVVSLMDGVSLLAYPSSMRQRDAGDLPGSGTMMLASSYMTWVAVLICFVLRS